MNSTTRAGGKTHAGTRYRILFTCLTLAWMLFIFCMSSADKEDSGAQSGAVCEWICKTFIEDYAQLPPARQMELQRRISFPVRKGAHLTEYTILGVLLTLTVSAWDKPAKKTPAETETQAVSGIRTGTAVTVLVIGFFYAVSDEVHQLFVAGRAGQPRDVLIDTAGVLLGIFLCGIFKKKRPEASGAGRKHQAHSTCNTGVLNSY